MKLSVFVANVQRRTTRRTSERTADRAAKAERYSVESLRNSQRFMFGALLRRAHINLDCNMNERKGGWTNERTDGRTDERTGGRSDGRHSSIYSIKNCNIDKSLVTHCARGGGFNRFRHHHSQRFFEKKRTTKFWRTRKA